MKIQVSKRLFILALIILAASWYVYVQLKNDRSVLFQLREMIVFLGRSILDRILVFCRSLLLLKIFRRIEIHS